MEVKLKFMKGRIMASDEFVWECGCDYFLKCFSYWNILKPARAHHDLPEELRAQRNNIFYFLKIRAHRNDLKHIKKFIFSTKKFIFSKKNWFLWKHGLTCVFKRAPSLQWSNTSLGYIQLLFTSFMLFLWRLYLLV
jgi:hypothetical protein